ncbi:(S)-3,5-dihydroxyphenylglycine transaminase [Catenulispora sp. GAS73]|uniref:aminotransferase class I/II-fold pyridoxal phosphate-dependent enzyme n=1 Tax=Catenulispora sp. GAS73 TaxID=3156269 RepID=UPI003514D6CA
MSFGRHPGPLDLADFADLARARLDPEVWDFIEGGAGQERTLAANTEAFDQIGLRPRVLANRSRPDPSAKVLGEDWTAPFGIAPTAYHTLVHPEGEAATARAAAGFGVPLTVSTFAGRPFADIARGTTGPLWLQVYCFRDRAVTRDLIAAAHDAGFRALMLTVDAPRLGRRLRDVRNGFQLPPGVVPANLPAGDYSHPGSHAATEFEPFLDWSTFDWLRSISPLPVLVKGILRGDDARLAVGAGADGIVVSNHGGRQLDGAPATLRVLPEVVEAAGAACPVLLDGGVRRGRDVLAALALGADAVLLGRSVLHGLAVAGAEGVRQVLDIMHAELLDAMELAGVDSVAQADPETVWSSDGPVRIASPPAPQLPQAQALPAQSPQGRPLRKEALHASVSDPVLDTMNFLNEITARYPDAISFAPGRPYGALFSTEKVFEHLQGYLDHLRRSGQSPEQTRDALFQYGPAAGQIREVIAASLRADEGIDVSPEAIVVTVGCQEAMFLAVRALIAGPDDVLLVASPCYVGIAGAARVLDVTIRPVEERADGLWPADVEAAVAGERARGRNPRAFYVVPDHSNPSGTTMSLAARHELIAVARRLGILILEDSPYRLVSPGAQLPTLKSLDPGGTVVHLGSLSKTLFPGARVGYAVADQVVVDSAGGTSLLADELAKLKSMITVNTPTLSQAVVAGMLLSADTRASRLTVESSAHYGEAMAATLRALDRHFPPERRAALGVHWNRPEGGFFLTLSVPFRADEAALARSAQDFGVIWTPMAYFHPDGGGQRTIRLSVSYLTLDDIAQGVERLARFVAAESSAGLEETTEVPQPNLI